VDGGLEEWGFSIAHETVESEAFQNQVGEVGEAGDLRKGGANGGADEEGKENEHGSEGLHFAYFKDRSGASLETLCEELKSDNFVMR